MKNSPLITQARPVEDLNAFIHGYDGCARTPTRVAWTLENTALRAGWPSGVLLGSESELLERFAVNREVLREAIRMLEARGAMCMERGCKGGLRLVSPGIDQAANALATYLHAHGCTKEQIFITATVAEPLIASLGEDHLLVALYRRTLAVLADDVCAYRSTLRAPRIAMALIQAAMPIPETGVWLGSEDELCERFNTCRNTLRQTLRMLDDMGMLHIRRGRGGGYALQRPTLIGIIRQLFALLASRQQTLTEIVPAMWALNLASLRLAMRRLRSLNAVEKAERLEVLNAQLSQSPEPRRWASFQFAIEGIADSALIITLQHCLVAYHARLGPPQAAWYLIDAELLQIENEIVRALRCGDEQEAERCQRAAQDYLSRLFHQ